MTFQKIVCLNFTGDEFDAQLWHEIDELAAERMIATADNPPPTLTACS